MALGFPWKLLQAARRTALKTYVRLDWYVHSEPSNRFSVQPITLSRTAFAVQHLTCCLSVFRTNSCKEIYSHHYWKKNDQKKEQILWAQFTQKTQAMTLNVQNCEPRICVGCDHMMYSVNMCRRLLNCSQ